MMLTADTALAPVYRENNHKLASSALVYINSGVDAIICRTSSAMHGLLIFPGPHFEFISLYTYFSSGPIA